MSLPVDVRIGSQRPVHLHLPTNRSGNSAGPEAVELARIAGLHLDDWQEWLLEESLAEDDEGFWAAFEVGLLVARQNGKGTVLEARQLAGLFLLGEKLQVHSAHEFKTAQEHFQRISALIENCPDFESRIQRIRRGAGEQAVELKNGCRLRFLARSSGSGRGFTGDAVYLDEAYALNTAQMGALMPTLSAVHNPQIWYTSSASKFSSDVLHKLIQRGRDGGSSNLFYADWGLDPGVDMSDPENWYMSNPGMGIRIPEAFVEAEYEAMRAMPAEFARERLGVHEGLAGDTGKIRVTDWDDLTDPDSSIDGRPVFAFDVSPESAWASVAVAGRRHDGLGHIELFERREGSQWLLDFLSEIWEANREPIRCDPVGPAGALINRLVERGVEIVEVGQREHAQACGSLFDAVKEKQLFHRVDPRLRAAVVGAKERTIGDVWQWSRAHSEIDISPLVAATLAWGGVPVKKEKRVAEAHIVMG